MMFATVLCVLSMLLLTFFINGLTAILTFITLIGYAVIYTSFLKHVTVQNIVIGGLLVLHHHCWVGLRLPVIWIRVVYY